MKARRVVFWLVGVAVIGVGIFYAAFVHRLRQDIPVQLLACAHVSPALMSWTCKAILRHDSLRPDQVADLNREAGAAYTLYGADSGFADEMLSLFLEKGVDINARNQSVDQHWTALHLLAMDGRRPDRITMLLKHGARPDVRDGDGMSALDLARRELQRYPNDPNRAEVVRLLEAVSR